MKSNDAFLKRLERVEEKLWKHPKWKHPKPIGVVRRSNPKRMPRTVAITVTNAHWFPNCGSNGKIIKGGSFGSLLHLRSLEDRKA
jgi:hypothetical protein